MLCSLMSAGAPERCFNHFSVTSELLSGRREIGWCMRKQGLATCVLHIKTPLNRAHRSFNVSFSASGRIVKKKLWMFAMSMCRSHDANFRFRFHSSASSPRPLTLRVVLLVSALVCLIHFLFLRHVYYHPSTVFVKLAAFCPLVRTAGHFRSSLNWITSN